MKETVEAYLGTKVEDADVTATDWCDDFQCQATKGGGATSGAFKRFTSTTNPLLQPLPTMKGRCSPTTWVAALASKVKAAARSQRGVRHSGLREEELRQGPCGQLRGIGTSPHPASAGGERECAHPRQGWRHFVVSLLTTEDGISEVKAAVGDIHLWGEDLVDRFGDFCIQVFREQTMAGTLLATSGHRGVSSPRANLPGAPLSSSTRQPSILFLCAIAATTPALSPVPALRMSSKDYCGDPMGLVVKCLRDKDIDKCSVHEVLLDDGSVQTPKVQPLVQEFVDGKGARQVHQT